MSLVSIEAASSRWRARPAVKGRRSRAPRWRLRPGRPGSCSPSSRRIGLMSANGGGDRNWRLAAGGFGGALVFAGLLGGFFPRGAERLRRYTPWLLALGLFFAAVAGDDRQARAAAAAVLSAAARAGRSVHRRLARSCSTAWSPRSSWSCSASSSARSPASSSACRSAGRAPFGYWVHPVMRFIGPLPSIAWLPIAFFAFPVELVAPRSS